MPAEASEDVAGVEAAKALTRTQGISYDEAMRRISIQERQADLAVAYEEALGPDGYGGSYIDHERGGALVIRPVAGHEVPTDVEGAEGLDVIFDEAPRSLADVNAALDEVLVELEADGIEAAAMFRPQTGTVRVSVPEDYGNEAAVQGARRSAGDFISIVAEGVPEDAACRTTVLLCDPPIRGGTAMISTEGSICTGGFNVRNSAGEPFILTAGHCVPGGFPDGPFLETRHYDYSYHTLGRSWVDRRVSADVDAGLLKLSNPPSWDPTYRLLVYASGGTPPTTRNEQYPLEGVGASLVGMSLCKTGAATLTKCGVVYALGEDHPGGGFGNENMGVLVADVCQGDSGGPIYIGNRAYGITSRYHPTGSYDIYNKEMGFGPVPVSTCADITWYVGAGQALGLTNTTLVVG